MNANTRLPPAPGVRQPWPRSEGRRRYEFSSSGILAFRDSRGKTRVWRFSDALPERGGAAAAAASLEDGGY